MISQSATVRSFDLKNQATRAAKPRWAAAPKGLSLSLSFPLSFPFLLASSSSRLPPFLSPPALLLVSANCFFLPLLFFSFCFFWPGFQSPPFEFSDPERAVHSLVSLLVRVPRSLSVGLEKKNRVSLSVGLSLPSVVSSSTIRPSDYSCTPLSLPLPPLPPSLSLAFALLSPSFGPVAFSSSLSPPSSLPFGDTVIRRDLPFSSLPPSLPV